MHSRSHCCRGKAVSIKYYKCVSVFLHYLADMQLAYFPTLSHKLHDFRKKLLNIKCMIFSTTFVWNILILRRNQRHIIINVHKSSCKVPLFLSDFNKTRIFSENFREVLKYQILWKSVQWEPNCSTWTEGRMDRYDEANSRSSKSCECA
jgi:hypothetical protein